MVQCELGILHIDILLCHAGLCQYFLLVKGILLLMSCVLGLYVFVLVDQGKIIIGMERVGEIFKQFILVAGLERVNLGAILVVEVFCLVVLVTGGIVLIDKVDAVELLEV